MVKKLLAMVLGVTMLIGATGCSAVDTGSGTGTSDTKSDTQVSVNADLLDATQYKSDKEAADWTIAVVVILFQPGNDDGGIQTARVSQNNFLNIFLFHDDRSFVYYAFYTFVFRPGIPPGALDVLSF